MIPTRGKKPFHLQGLGKTGWLRGTWDLLAMFFGPKMGVRGAGVGVLQRIDQVSRGRGACLLPCCNACVMRVCWGGVLV